MIRIIAGGKKNVGWAGEAIFEYEKRLSKPFLVKWEFLAEERLAEFLEKWPFTGREFVICLDERGKNISSPEFAGKLEKAFLESREVVVLIGGAYGFSEEVRKRADFVWSFSKLVFPHMLARVMAIEQIYRASQISAGRPYHHE